MSIIPDISGVRGSLYCYRCGGGFWTRGQNQLVRHAPGCPRSPHRTPQSTQAQDRERAALAAPFPGDDLGEEYLPRTEYRGRSWWEPEEYTIAGGR